jgi:hypothetical protein
MGEPSEEIEHKVAAEEEEEDVKKGLGSSAGGGLLSRGLGLTRLTGALLCLFLTLLLHLLRPLWGDGKQIKKGSGVTDEANEHAQAREHVQEQERERERARGREEDQEREREQEINREREREREKEEEREERREEERVRMRWMQERLSRSPLPVDVARGPPLPPPPVDAATATGATTTTAGEGGGDGGSGGDNGDGGGGGGSGGGGIVKNISSKPVREIRYSGEGKWVRLPPPPLPPRPRHNSRGRNIYDDDDDDMDNGAWNAAIAAVLAGILVAADFLSATEVEQIFILRCFRFGAWGLDLLTDPIFPQVGRALLAAVARAAGGGAVTRLVKFYT